MANENKAQPDDTAKPAVKKAPKKKAPAKKRAAAKKATTKTSASNKRVVKKVAPKPASTEKKNTVSEEVVVAIALEHPTPPPQQSPQTTTPTRQIWWRAAIMVAVVVLIFTAIRNATHTEPSLTDKSVAPAPWASQEPRLEAGQPHPWELAPVSPAGNFSEQPPYYAPSNQQTSPHLEPWQDAPQQTKPYYPPPPGPYGFTPSVENTAPYPR